MLGSLAAGIIQMAHTPDPIPPPAPRRRPLAPFVILGLSLLATAGIALYVGQAASDKDRAHFEHLADRTQSGIVAHMETRDTAIYALVRARADDRLGPRLKPSTMDCGPMRAQRAATIAEAARSRGGRVPVPPAPSPDEPVVCQMRVSGRGGSTLTYRAGNITMSALAGALRTYVGREVVDRTGLRGEFDFDLQFSAPPTTAQNRLLLQSNPRDAILESSQDRNELARSSSTSAGLDGTHAHPRSYYDSTIDPRGDM